MSKDRRTGKGSSFAGGKEKTGWILQEGHQRKTSAEEVRPGGKILG